LSAHTFKTPKSTCRIFGKLQLRFVLNALIRAALRSRCGHYIFAPCFFSFLVSSPNLSGRRLDVYHTSIHGIALVRIYDAGLKRAARGSLKIKDPKKSPKIRHLGTIAQFSRAISSQLKHISTIGKKLIKQRYLQMSSQYGERRSANG